MKVSVFCLVLGALLTWLGWRHWRYRNEETISVLEVGILKTTGVEPLPRTRLDRFLTYVHVFFGFTLGPLFLLVGIAGIFMEVGLL